MSSAKKKEHFSKAYLKKLISSTLTENTPAKKNSNVTKAASKVNGSVAKSGVAKRTPIKKKSKKSKKQGTLLDRQRGVTKTIPEKNKTVDKRKKSIAKDGPLKKTSQDGQSDVTEAASKVSGSVAKSDVAEHTPIKKKSKKSKEQGTLLNSQRSVTKKIPEKNKTVDIRKKSTAKDESLKKTSQDGQSDVTKAASKVNGSVAKSDVAEGTPVKKKSKKSKKQGTLLDRQSDVTKAASKENGSVVAEQESAAERTPIKKKKKRSKKRGKLLNKRTVDPGLGIGSSIIVRNLGTRKRSALVTHFRQYGKVKSVKIITFGWVNKNPKTKKKVKKDNTNACAAVVNFIDSTTAKAALASDKEELEGKEMKVILYTEKPTLSWKRSVVIKNISKDLQEEDIRDKFEACGEINCVDIVNDGEPDSNSINAILNFKTPEGANTALKWNGKALFGEESILIERHLPQSSNPNKQKPKTKDKKKSGNPPQKISTNDDSNWIQDVLEGAEQDYNASQRKHLGFYDEENSNSLKFSNRSFGSENTWMHRDQRSSSNFRYSARGNSYDDQYRNWSFDRQGQTFSADRGKHIMFDNEENNLEGRDQRFSGNSYGDQSRKRKWDEQDSTFGADMNFQNQVIPTTKKKVHIVFDD